MKWTIIYYNENLQEWVDQMPVGIRAAYTKLTELLTDFGMDLRMPHSRPMGGGLFELRPKGKEGIARIFYCTMAGKQIVMLHGFIKKTQETPNKESDIARRRMKEVKNAHRK
ncbi:MAG: hypothetical protein ACD_44C00108G0003 [uncultured bacterium]|nr:MAG: hypothetical protein ACD_44C00108G0003 [uncultured bacterium]OGT32531.1 MAG: hypothetical protein A3C44_02155 [Gammaproteobacteria bacterium RIFCSPHIGHO2_02_FULL_39_13]OGT48339.1 MAG: hypothetical protein A3E53_05850 [Gammaproteobacteria bacterium RIFCSPHIGHO2_12_FULL_39_24]